MARLWPFALLPPSPTAPPVLYTFRNDWSSTNPLQTPTDSTHCVQRTDSHRAASLEMAEDIGLALASRPSHVWRALASRPVQQLAEPAAISPLNAVTLNPLQIHAGAYRFYLYCSSQQSRGLRTDRYKNALGLSQLRHCSNNHPFWVDFADSKAQGSADNLEMSA
ncbi:hypothetical protein FB451DRAFT_1180857 [Mycena latifolia]|nr:hypothetical protein FB451DRAFT_1180857 [Mycena latifolia]